MDWLKERINKARSIKANSLNAYIISIKKIRDGVTDGDAKDNLEFLENVDKVKGFISKFKLSTQKNYLAAIVVSLGAFDETYKSTLNKYRELLDDLKEEYKKQYENGEKSEKQQKNWMALDQLRKVQRHWKRELTERDVFQKRTLTTRLMMMVQKWLITHLLLGDDNPPTRLDYAPMEVISDTEFNKLPEKERKENNYLVVKSRTDKTFHFNEYKTSGKYGEKVVPVGKKLNSAINIWLKFNDTDSFLLNSKGQPLSANGFGKLIKEAFAPTGKDITINMIRHIYISERFPNVDNERQEVADKMGHSVEQQSKYSKR